MAELLDLAQRLVASARDGEQIEAFCSRNARTSVRVYESEVESFTSAQQDGAGIRVIIGGRTGFASAGSLDEVVLKETLEEARDNAAYAQPDDDALLAQPDGLPRPSLEVAVQFSLTPQERIDRALELERMVLSKDSRLRVRNASWSDLRAEQAVASTTGIASWGETTWCSASVGALAADGDKTQTAGGQSIGRGPGEIVLEEAADEAARDTLRMLGASKPESALLTAVFAPQATVQLLGVIGRMLSGEALVKSRTPFLDRIGEDVAAAAVTLVDDGTDVRSLGAWPDDDEGLASRRNVLIEGGALRGFLHDFSTGRRAGTGSTGSAGRTYATTPAPLARGLYLVPGTSTQDEVFASITTGVLIASMSGLHSGVSPVSGDFSVGASGLMIRDGALAEPVQEMTVASTIQRMLLDVVAIGGDERWFSQIAGVSLAVADISLGGR